MTRRNVLLVVAAGLAATLCGCEMVRGDDRVWRPGDPDPSREEFYGPWSNGHGPVPEPADVNRPLR